MTICPATQRVADYLRRHPDEWVSALTLAEIGGLLSSRSRISEARRFLGMAIANRTRTKKKPDGSYVRLSEFRYTPSPLVRP